MRITNKEGQPAGLEGITTSVKRPFGVGPSISMVRVQTVQTQERQLHL